ncbi:MAG: 4-hydroxy-3-methylbut-2-enyl diphosphate reductase, partial [Planctomycetota bacterium]|nr:4-hydroxy-3-methylbut-2-enyl diphosphate reductase [Planctomycetota bacterium]
KLQSGAGRKPGSKTEEAGISRMKVTVAKALGTCFGVQDAIDLAMDEAYRDKLTIVGQLVHNPQVVEDLRIRGVNIVDKLDENISTPNVMITAHGAPESMHENARKMGYHVIDASCPLVLRVHKAIAGFVREGFHPVVIGQASHVEVKGIIGDLQDYTIIANEDELSSLAPYQKIGIVSQTTQQIRHVKSLIEKIHETYPEMEIRFQDTVCQPTKDRQVAARELTSEVDLMIVIGGYNSSNTKKLKMVCDESGVEAFHIERASQLSPEMFEGREHVGITAGTSTPREVIEEVYLAILSMPGVIVSEASGMPPKEKYLH